MLKRYLTSFVVLMILGCGSGGEENQGTSAPAPEPAVFKVVSVSPSDGAKAVAPSSVIVANLNLDIDQASVDLVGSNFNVKQGGNNIPGVVSVVGQTISFTPKSYFSSSATVKVELIGLKSKIGIEMESKTWSFAPGYTVPPKVITVIPEQTGGDFSV